MLKTISTAIRFLAPTEAMFAESGVYSGYAVRTRGKLDCAALSDAFEALRDRHPLLGARLGTVDGRYVFLGNEAPPDVIVFDGDPETPLLGAAANPGLGLAYLRVVRDGALASVTLQLNHSLADAGCGAALLAELWSLYTDRMNGEIAAPGAPEYADSMEDVLARRGISRPDYVGTRASLADAEPAPLILGDDIPGERAAAARCLLSARTTQAVIESARGHGVTVHGVASAAIMLACSAVEDLPLTEINYVSPVDLRTRIDPPVAPTAVTNMLGYSPFQPGAGTTDLVGIARAVNEQLRVHVSQNSLVIGGLYVPDLAKSNASSPGKGLLGTNGGVLPQFRTPEGLEIETAFPAPFRRPPGGTPLVNGVNGRETYKISTYAGQLAIEMASYETDSATMAIVTTKVAAIEDQLMSLLR